MKPKHHKTVRCSRPKRRNQLQRHNIHQHHLVPMDPTGTSVNAHKSDTEENDLEPLSKTFDLKCSTQSYKDSKIQFQKHDDDDDDDDSESEAERYNALFQSVRERREQLVERLRIYNNLFKFHKSIKEDQVYLYRKLQDMDELYLRNTAAILRLGFCPCLVHQQTSPVGDLLMKIHRKLRLWDKKMEEICDILKEPSTRKTTAAIFQILKICDNTQFIQDQMDFSDVALPEIVWDLDNPFLEQLNTSKLTEDWRNVRKDVRESLCKVEIKFQEVCLEFGITKGPEQTPSTDSEPRSFAYENVSMIADSDEISNNDHGDDNGNKTIDEVEDADIDGSSGDTPSSKVSSSFF